MFLVSQSLRVDDEYRLVDDDDDPFASKFMSFEVSRNSSLLRSSLLHSLSNDADQSLCFTGYNKPS